MEWNADSGHGYHIACQRIPLRQIHLKFQTDKFKAGRYSRCPPFGSNANRNSAL